MDAYDVLGLAPTFDLDLKQLEQRYRDLQRALHPDKYVQASASERRASLSRAVRVNDAYRLLRDPLKRAELLLARHGVAVSEQSAAPADPALLLEVMELREQLSEARGAAQKARRDALARDVRGKQEESTTALRGAFARLAEADESARDLAGRALARLRYYKRFLDEVGVLDEDAHDDG